MLERPAFLLDISRCTGCATCVIACKDRNNPENDLWWRKVTEISSGGWQEQPDGSFSQDITTCYISMSCNHCERPSCVAACPTGAMCQGEDGLVLVDAVECIACGACLDACPYDAPKLDDENEVMTKCDFCRDEIIQGRDPICVTACPTRALSIVEYDELARDESLAEPPHINSHDPDQETGPRLFLKNAAKLTRGI